MKSMADELAHEHAKPYLDELARRQRASYRDRRILAALCLLYEGHPVATRDIHTAWSDRVHVGGTENGLQHLRVLGMASSPGRGWVPTLAGLHANAAFTSA